MIHVAWKPNGELWWNICGNYFRQMVLPNCQIEIEGPNTLAPACFLWFVTFFSPFFFEISSESFRKNVMSKFWSYKGLERKWGRGTTIGSLENKQLLGQPLVLITKWKRSPKAACGGQCPFIHLWMNQSFRWIRYKIWSLAFYLRVVFILE